MEFVESHCFAVKRSRLLSDDELRTLEEHLAVHPTAGDVIEGTGGVRKLRWGDPRRGKGKRGGSRVLYFYFLTDSLIYLMAIYGKGEKDDLTAEDKKLIRTELSEEKEARRQARRG